MLCEQKVQLLSNKCEFCKLAHHQSALLATAEMQ